MSSAIAFLDVDHTLARRSTGYRFAMEALSRGLIRARSLAAVPFLYLQYRLGRPGPDTVAKERAMLRGIPRAAFEEAARAAFASRGAADIFPEALELVESIRAAGRRVFLATSSFDLVIAPIAELLRVDGLVCSALEFDDQGVSTGRFAGMPAFGPLKLERAAATAEREGVALSDCSFYSDSIHDLPLLLAVGEPVAVNPDSRLEREAKRRGWKILSFGARNPAPLT